VARLSPSPRSAGKARSGSGGSAFWRSGPRPRTQNISVGDLKRAFAAAESEGAEALIVGLDAVTEANRTAIAELAASRRLPTIYPAKEFVEAGGLIAYASNVVDLYRRAAAYVDRILKGTKPGDLPVEQPIKFELIINLKTAKAMGASIPPSLLARADEVIE
jgi:putative ABC transport system substrate-binding protein